MAEGTPQVDRVSVAVSALSYTGTPTITIAADAGRTPDLPVLVTALRSELEAMR
ncbi:WS/DGAT domain-containing protein [Nonomuraea sp. NPDC050022]|uniref:WS/DGAT domain-containing protein n=1 Tax=unclassified Nonomuraea TaxID=2593643 RepID=UPI0033E324D4